MINSLQITALLPLTNITIPSEAFEFFEVILAIVAFDFFPLYDPGFTETDSYNEKFAWFGFDSVNFVQDLGTFLNFLIWLLVLQSITALCLYCCTAGLDYWFKH